ncbi:MAG: MBOAT family protein [Spirochaetes bacterium]|nr:MBOAT family protein [Spirochaetota bacterium]
MVFNSFLYILCFLPLVCILYRLLEWKNVPFVSRVFLAAASLVFYGWASLASLPVLLASILFNYASGVFISERLKDRGGARKALTALAIGANVILLGYFKYSNFFIENVNLALGTNLGAVSGFLPLGISFYTFIQISFLVDCYRGTVTPGNALNYGLFVAFFPKVTAGPLMTYKEILPQFALKAGKAISGEIISRALFIFALGLFKKSVIADNLAPCVNQGFDTVAVLTLFEAWAVSLGYTLQLYFDFSGYTDMAMGAALLLGVRLPVNFSTPYRSLDVRDFWRRWHVTLGAFLGSYLYIPLGGNRKGAFATYRNLMITFLICGVWHGAGWTFILWGFLHGAAIVIHRMWTRLGFTMNGLFAWVLTFSFVNICWVFFRANTIGDALKVVRGMFLFNGITLPEKLEPVTGWLKGLVPLTYGHPLGGINGDIAFALLIALGFVLSVFGKNSDELAGSFKPTFGNALVTGSLIFMSLLMIAREKVVEFIYFNF